MTQQILSPVLVGRDDHLATLEDHLLAARRGHSRLVVLGGEAGIGKTRLAAELARRAEALGITVMWGGCSEAQLTLPYLPVVEAIGNYLAVSDLKSIKEQLGEARRDLGQLFPQLRDERPPEQIEDATQAKLRLFESLVLLVSHAAGHTGLLLVIEDVHWADASTRELLEYLARRLREQPILLLLTYRSDELHRKHPLLPTIQAWKRSRGGDVVDLDQMSPGDVAEIIEAIFDMHERTPAFRDLMHERAEGNPFVLEELLKEAVDRGDIYKTDSGWARRPVEDLRIPESVKDSILLRLHRLDENYVGILQAASVIGRSFHYEILTEICGCGETEVQRGLEVAVAHQLIVPVSDGEAYTFRHALTQEAIYEELVAPKRRSWHSRAADALAQRPDASPVERALHLLEAGRYEEAVPVCVGAAEYAERISAYTDAAHLYERALEHVSEDERAELVCRLGRAAWSNGESTAAAAYLDEGIDAMRAAGRERNTAEYLLIRGRCRWEMSRPDLARTDYEAVRILLEPEGPSEELALSYMRLSGLLSFALDFGPAHEIALKAVETARAAGAEEAYAWSLGFLGLTQVDMGDVDKGLASLDRSFRQGLSLGSDRVAMNSLWNEIFVRAHYDLPGASERLKEFTRIRSWALIEMMQGLAAAYAARSAGDIPGWVASAERAFRIASELRMPKFVWRAKLMVAEVNAELNDLDRARESLPDPSERTEHQDLIYDAAARVRVNKALGRRDELVNFGEAVAREARRLPNSRRTIALGVEALVFADRLEPARELLSGAERVPFPAGQAHLELAHGRIALAQGDFASAQDRFTNAAKGFADIGFELEELRARTLATAALGGLGDLSSAEHELSAAVRNASVLQAWLILAEAQEVAQSLGLEIEGVQAKSEPPIRTGERLVTVLFSDVRGYTALSQESPPAAIAERITALQRWAKREVESNYGVVDKFAGDAVMATFNITGERVDHCLDALRAARALRDKAAAAGLSIGSGIATGPAVVGQLAEGANLSVIGETTNLAARLQSQALGGEILLSAEAYRRLRTHVGEVSPEKLELKGFARPVSAHRIT